MPGTSGILSPFGKINGLYFNDSREPDDFEFNFKQDLSRILKEEDCEYIEIKCDNKEDYYKLLDKLVKFNKNAIKVYGTSKEEYNIILETDEDENIDT